jgi:hypothetical protein
MVPAVPTAVTEVIFVLTCLWIVMGEPDVVFVSVQVN